MKSGTWDLVPLPEGRTIMQNKWVFYIKPGHNDLLPRFKARLVAKGFTQEVGVDYEETSLLFLNTLRSESCSASLLHLILRSFD